MKRPLIILTLVLVLCISAFAEIPQERFNEVFEKLQLAVDITGAKDPVQLYRATCFARKADTTITSTEVAEVIVGSYFSWEIMSFYQSRDEFAENLDKYFIQILADKKLWQFAIEDAKSLLANVETIRKDYELDTIYIDPNGYHHIIFSDEDVENNLSKFDKFVFRHREDILHWISNVLSMEVVES